MNKCTPWLIIFGLMGFCFGIFLLYNDVIKVISYPKTEGIIVEHKYSTSGRGRSSYSLIAKYNINGKEYTAQSKLSTGLKYTLKPVGKKTIVKYNPNNPNDAIIDNIFSLCTFYTTIIIIGLFVTYLGIKPPKCLLNINLQPRNSTSTAIPQKAETAQNNPPAFPDYNDLAKEIKQKNTLKGVKEIILGLLGMACIIIAITIFAFKIAFSDLFVSFLFKDIAQENRRTVTGKVTESKVSKIEDGEEYKVSVAEYKVGGKIYKIKSLDSSPNISNLDDIGQKVKIIYDVNNPNTAFYINTKPFRPIGWGINGVILLFALSGLFCIYKMLKSIFKENYKIIYEKQQ